LKLARLDKEAFFTIREWATTAPGKFEYQVPVWETLDCVESVSYYSEEYGRYRQAIFKAITDDCRTTLSRKGIDDDGEVVEAETLDLEVVVWPIRQPEATGKLYDLDAGDRQIIATGQSQFTIRASEGATPTGYMFLEPPEDQEFQCVILEDRNLGNFNTGFRQFLFTAKDEALECSETLDLVHSSHSQTPGVVEQIEFSITKASCAFVECPAGEVQEAYFCGCMAEPEVEGDLFDFDLDDRNRVARVMVGERFTMKEASSSLDGRTYTYDLP